MNAELLIQARQRIIGSLKLYEKYQLEFLSHPVTKNYIFIDRKYGTNHYESYKDNQLYGNGAAYRYAHNLTADSKLHIVIPHGFMPGDIVYSKELLAELPIACFSDHAKYKFKRVAEKYKRKVRLFSSVHPFQSLLYKVDKLKSSIKKDIEPTEEAIFFPLHSTGKIKSNMHSVEDCGKSTVELLQNKYKNVNLCIYFIDYMNLKKLGKWDSYKSQFNKVYCCGSRYEPAYLLNLALVLKEHKYLITEGVGSHIFFGSMSGTKLDLINYNASAGTYNFKDEMDRPDKEARKKNFEALAELHCILDECKDRKELIINRHVSHYSSLNEQNIEKNYIQAIQESTCKGLEEGFDDLVYPLIE